MHTQKNTVCVDNIIQKLLNSDHRGKDFSLSEDQIAGLCFFSKAIMMGQPMLLELRPPINICGDLHGQFEDLKKIFESVGSPETGKNFLFLGDYIDRGKYSLECICLLLAYKIKYKENFFLLRGNHECSQTNKVYGFFDECKRRSSLKSWKCFSDCFNCFPVAAVVGNRIFCVHGGISPQLKHINEINDIKRPTQMKRDTLMCDLLWSDPAVGEGWEENYERGVSYFYGRDVISSFLEKYDFDLICRSHQVVEDGYRFFGDRTLVTIFSAPNYCGDHNNNGSILIVDENMKCSLKIMFMDEKQKVKKKRQATPIPKKVDQNMEENEKKRRQSENSKQKKRVRRINRQRTPTKMIMNDLKNSQE